MPEQQAFTFETAETTVGAALVVIYTSPALSGVYSTLGLEVEANTQAVDQCILEGQVHPSGSWHSVAADWATPDTAVVDGDDIAAVSATSEYAIASLRGLYKARVKVACGATGGKVTVRGNYTN